MARRVTILGGGIAGLTAAYELTRTAEGRARHEVDVYELGHRLGGRLASGHRADRWGRNEEHGLHVWFGFYDNTLRLAEQVWADAPIPADCPWSSVWDGLRPIRWSDHALPVEGSYAVRRVQWGPGDLLPETPSAEAALKAVRGIAGLLLLGPSNLLSLGLDVPTRSPLSRALSRIDRALAPALAGLRSVTLPETLAGRRALGIGVWRLLRRVHGPLVAALRRLNPVDGLDEVVSTVDLLLAVLRGACSPEHGILEDGDLDRVSAFELSDWLVHHGADARTVDHGQLLHALYDIPFAFRDGDRGRRVMEASTALRYSLRLAFGYRDAVAYLLSAGAGETLVAPLVALLRQRGVRFHLFHRLEDLGIDAGARRVSRLDLVRAARTRPGHAVVVERGGFLALPEGPDFDELHDGEALRARGVRFDSRFGDRGEADRVTLRDGVDFDEVILALPLGCVQPDGDGHSPVAAWLALHPPARACLSRLHLVPTVAAQIWLDEPPDALGLLDRAVVTWAAPYSVVCDMSPVIAHERWPGPGPRSSLYLCGAWPLTAHRAPSSSVDALHRDEEEARRALFAQLERHGAALIGDGTLHAPPGVDDPWTAQYVRANVEPWDLADLPLPGADRCRLEATDSGLGNLALAGTWVRTLVNTTSVEAAVASGIAAARALGAEVQPILAEGLLRRAPAAPVLSPALEPRDDLDLCPVPDRLDRHDAARHAG